MNDNQTRVRFQKSVKELVRTNGADLQKIFKDGVLKACDEMLKKKSKIDGGDMWWWNDEVKGTVARKKAAFEELCVSFH